MVRKIGEAKVNLRDIDLNLLVIFNQLLIDRKVSITAERLNLTQPAVSNALRRLRVLLNDPLFIRTAKGMEPTYYSLQLAEPVASALSTLHLALNHNVKFDPGSSHKVFTLALTDIGEIYFMPHLMKFLSKHAPNIKIETTRNDEKSLQGLMESGVVDLAIGLLPRLQIGMFQRRLFDQYYVCMYRKGHPLASSPLSLETFSALRHLVVVSQHTGHGDMDILLQRSGIERNIQLEVPHFTAVGHILQHTDLIASVPERLADQCIDTFDLEVSPHPISLPAISINLFWHSRFHRDPANSWLRQIIFDLFLE